MRVVLQRVSEAKVTVDGEIAGAIGPGLLILLGISRTDTRRDCEYLAGKVTGLRIFMDDNGKMNRSVTDLGGSLLVVSQFTLYGDCRKGRRPGFDAAADPETARQLYEYFVAILRERSIPVETEIFQASMKVSLVNDGPVTLIVDSDK